MTRQFYFRYSLSQVELIDGEKQEIGEKPKTFYCYGDPVELPQSPYSAVKWDMWMRDFCKTHKLVSDYSADDARSREEGTCFVIVPPQPLKGPF